MWQAVTVVDVVAQYFSNSLSAGVAREPGRAAALSRAVRRRLLGVLAPALAVGVLAAEPALALFGPAYAGEATALRSCSPGSSCGCWWCTASPSTRPSAGACASPASPWPPPLGIVGVAALAPAGPGGPLVSVAAGFVVVQAVCAAAVGCNARRPGRRWTRHEHDDHARSGRTHDRGHPELVSGSPRRGPDTAAVAVCVPVYQGGRHVEATLRSVLAETAVDLELVVLDNASTDATAAVLAGIDDPRLVVWRNPVTVPMLENFDRAVALSHAPLVKLLPADDVLEPGCLDAQVGAFAADPGLALVVGRKHLVDEHGRVLARGRFVRHGLAGTHERTDVLRRVVRSGANPIGADAAATFRRDAYTAAGGYPDDAGLGDLELWLRLLEHGRFLGMTTDRGPLPGGRRHRLGRDPPPRLPRAARLHRRRGAPARPVVAASTSSPAACTHPSPAVVGSCSTRPPASPPASGGPDERPRHQPSHRLPAGRHADRGARAGRAAPGRERPGHDPSGHDRPGEDPAGHLARPPRRPGGRRGRGPRCCRRSPRSSGSVSSRSRGSTRTPWAGSAWPACCR